MYKFLAILLLVLVVLIGGVGGFYFGLLFTPISFMVGFFGGMISFELWNK